MEDVAMRYVELAGRVLFSMIFITAVASLFSHDAIVMATEHGVPMANWMVPFAGLVALSGGLSVLLGCKTRLGGWLIVLFLVPVTLMMHNFWDVRDVMTRQMQEVNFFKNLSMLGGALVISYFGA